MNDELAFGELLLSEKKSKIPYILLYAVIAVLVVLVFFYYFFGCAIVEGQSMESTLETSQRCLLIKHGFTVERGNIVTINHPKPEKDGEMLIKRVIALGGDRILFVRSQNNKNVDLYICKSGEHRFTLSTEKYVAERMNYSGTDSKFGYDVNGTIVPTTAYRSQAELESLDIDSADLDTADKLILDGIITVPDDCIYYMGDNRNHSSDSRYYGPCKESDITGKVIAISKKGSALEDFLNFIFSSSQAK
ncbi:MAG: signal peptidase I [Clostridiales bacterium]|nr:signal peptidase I [Clostridiales bacterium]